MAGAAKGSGTVDRRPSGKWRARVRVDGRAFSKTFPTEREARAWLRDMESDARRGLLTEPPTAPAVAPTVGDLWTRYRAGWQGLAPTTERYYASCWALLEPAVGNVLAPNVKPSDLPALQAHLLTKVGTTRAKGSILLLGRLLHLAEVDGDIARNPVALARLRWPRSAPKDRPVLSPSDVADLASHAKHERDHVLILALGWGGLRIGEAFALQRRDIDLSTGTIAVRRSVSDAGGALTVGDTKTHRARTVTLPASVIESLRAQLRVVSIAPDAWLFPARDGGPLRYRSWTRDVFRPTAERWNVARNVDDLPPVSLTPHDLRSSCASLLIDAGASPKDVQAHLGHADIATTLNVYARVRPGRQAELAARMDELVAR